jgi:hypothetical protein
MIGHVMVRLAREYSQDWTGLQHTLAPLGETYDGQGVSVMATREDIEHYLIQLGHPHETIEDNMWVVRDEASIVISYEPPLVIFRSKLMDVPQKNREAFFRLLLELNASEMIHGAYGIEDNVVALIDTLQSEHLDFNEFQATLEALLLAITQDYQKLKSFRD